MIKYQRILFHVVFARHFINKWLHNVTGSLLFYQWLLAPIFLLINIYVKVSIAHDSSHWSHYSYREKVYNETIGELRKELGIGLFIIWAWFVTLPETSVFCECQRRTRTKVICCVCFGKFLRCFYRPFPGKNSRETILFLFYSSLSSSVEL